MILIDIEWWYYIFECVWKFSALKNWPLTFCERVYLFLWNPVFSYTLKPEEEESANTTSVWCNTCMWKTHVTESPQKWPIAKPRLLKPFWQTLANVWQQWILSNVCCFIYFSMLFLLLCSACLNVIQVNDNNFQFSKDQWANFCTCSLN